MSSRFDDGSPTRSATSVVQTTWRDDPSLMAWLGLCPLLAIAATWRIALGLAVCLLLTIAMTAAGLALLQRYAQQALRLPLAALIAGTVVVLLQLAITATPVGALQSLDAAIAPWLVLVAGLAALVCCLSDKADRNASTNGFGFLRSAKPAVALPIALLLIGVARDVFGRVFLIAAAPAGALVLFAMLLASVSVYRQDRSRASLSRAPALSPLGPSLRRDDKQNRSTPTVRADGT